VRRLIGGLLLLLLAVPHVAWGAKEFEKVGTMGGQFLKIPIGARATGMGGAFVSVADDPSAIFWNPSGIARLTESYVSFNHVIWPADVKLTQASYVFHVGFLPGSLGINARSLYMNQEPVRDVFHPEGTGEYFDAGDVSFGVSYARSLTDKFSAGFNLNYVRSGLAEFTSSSYTLDFGTLYTTGYRSLQIGMAIANLGSDMRFVERQVKMPTVFRVGVSMDLYQDETHEVLSAAEFSHPPDNREQGNWGVEYSFKDFFRVRGGYNFGYDSEGLSAGLGLKFPSSITGEAALDYSYTDMNVLGAAHRISLDLQF
jgi:hypothetical protein